MQDYRGIALEAQYRAPYAPGRRARTSGSTSEGTWMKSDSADSNVTVIGAGPYGLSSAAYLRAAGIETRVFGEPMSFWKQQMPVGMCLRSPLEGSNLADPDRRFTLKAYARTNGHPLLSPLPLDRFVDYGCWFQRQVVPDIDVRMVTRVEQGGTGFQLTLLDGEQIKAQRVIVAGGIVPFAYRPPQMQAL